MESFTVFDVTLGSYATEDKYSTCAEYKSVREMSKNTVSTSHRSDSVSNNGSGKMNACGGPSKQSGDEEQEMRRLRNPFLRARPG